MSQSTLQIRGACTHNLRGIDLDLPLSGLTVLVGPSGSGKSSLALDTVHAASRARLSSVLGARVGGAGDVRVGLLHNLPVTLAVSDRQSPRASLRVIDLVGLTDTVATLGLASGVVACADCGRLLPTTTADEMVAALLADADGQRLTLLAPVARQRTGGLGALVAEIGRQGFARVRVDGELLRVEDVPPVDARLPHDLDVVVDRLRVSADRHGRLAEAVGTCLAAGQGRLVALIGGGEEQLERSWSERPWCADHPRELCAPKVSWLAGGSQARCQTCEGRGGVDSGQPCPACAGSGLRQEVAGFLVGPSRRPWPELLTAPLAELAALLAPTSQSPHLGTLHEGLGERLALLDAVGLSALPSGRLAGELASGEVRRLQVLGGLMLAREIPGLLLVLDEPTAGLDAGSAARLVELLTRASAAGTAVLAVGHRRLLAERAGLAVAFGPGAGRRGGQVVWQGAGHELPQALLPSPAALPVPPPPQPRSAESGPALHLTGARGRCLVSQAAHGVHASFAIGQLTAVTGPSGSGKSTLVTDTLVPAARQALGLVGPPALAHDSLAGMDTITQLLTFDRSPLGRSARSCVVTALGAWSHLRTLLAATRDARILGLDAARFRFDQPGGRCEACEGTGLHQVEVSASFALSESRSSEPCPVCEGLRFQRETLHVRLKGRTVAELLDTDVQEASELFAHHRRLGPPLLAAAMVGLGYLPLGQPSATLSGGEVQRLRLAREFARAGGIGIGDPRRFDDRLVVLDAPTVGLHPDDVGAVIELLRRLADRGATVVVATVEPALLAAADAVLVLKPSEP